MSIHKSLKSKSGEFRSVRKRLERYKTLLKNGIKVKSIFGLPKEKLIKPKKQRVKEKEEEKQETTQPPMLGTTK